MIGFESSFGGFPMILSSEAVAVSVSAVNATLGVATQWSLWRRSSGMKALWYLQSLLRRCCRNPLSRKFLIYLGMHRVIVRCCLRLPRYGTHDDYLITIELSNGVTVPGC